MKIKSHDENGYPLNFDQSNYYITNEVFIDIPYYVSYVYDIDISRYMISNWGRVFDKFTNTYYPTELSYTRNDYVRKHMHCKNGSTIVVRLHILTALSFIGIVGFGPENIVVNHKDGVKWHNEPYNLEWVTSSDNVIHAQNNGLISRNFGEDNPESILSDDQYREICRLTQEGYYPNDINTIMNIGIDITNIAQKIRSGKSESIISNDYDFSNIPRHNYSKFTDNDVELICIEIQNGLNEDEILLKLFDINVNDLTRELRYLYRNRIRNIKNKKSFTNISNKYNF